MSDIRKPNLFIIGAPKCGTTAWYHYLQQHPDISFSEAKEPHYFCTDFPNFRWAKTEEQYLDLFADLPLTKYTGEASVMYLYSEEAIHRVKAFNREAKILIFLRSFESFFPSYHSQLFLMHDEDQNDLERVWNLQQERANGSAIPKDCREPKFLQYREVCRFGKQLERVFSVFPREQVKVIFFEEWTKDPRRTYLSIMEFLGLPDEGLNDFGPINTKRQGRSRYLSRLLHRPPQWMLNLSGGIRAVLGLKRLGLANRIKKLNEKNKAQHLALTDELAEIIHTDLLDERKLLEQLLVRRLNCWAVASPN